MIEYTGKDKKCFVWQRDNIFFVSQQKRRESMYYCGNCLMVWEDSRCPVCGKKKMKEPAPDDMCYLTEQQQVWAGMLEDVLTQKKIAYLTQPVLGAALSFGVGRAMERYRFYVPYRQLSDAKDVLEELFGGTG